MLARIDEPKTPPRNLDALFRLLEGRRICVLTGAGCSTESGIPDYRGPKTRHKTRNPVQYKQFVSSATMRQRYWARSVVGWQSFRGAEPNHGHLALATLEAHGRVTHVITQNVDRLHHRAGTRAITELHGALAEVRCLDCGFLEERDSLQARLLELNPGWLQTSAELAPDGDAVLPDEAYSRFRVAPCAFCTGTLKPNVVFFGENVDKPIVDASYRALAHADALLIVGSSLAVFSGYRFLLRANKLGVPAAIVNLGAPARGQERCDVFVDGRSGDVLPRLARALA